MQTKQKNVSFDEKFNTIFEYCINRYKNFESAITYVQALQNISGTLAIALYEELVTFYSDKSYAPGFDIPKFVTLKTDLANLGRSSFDDVYELDDQGAKYYARSDDKFIVNIDWLTIRLSQSLILDFSDKNKISTGPYDFIYCGYGTRMHKWVCDVYHNGFLIGQVCTHPHQAHIKFDTFKIDNKVFYDQKHREKPEIFTDHFFKWTGYKYEGISRLDIALDGVDLSHFIKSYAKGKDYKQLKVNNVYFKNWDIKKQEFEYFEVGKRSGKKFIQHYNKTKEITENGNKKQYIKNWHQKNEIWEPGQKDVWRTELRLNSEAINDIKDFDFNDLFVFDVDTFLCSIFQFHLNHFFEFVPKDHSDSRVSRRPRICLFDFRNLRIAKFERVPRTLLNTNRTIRIMVKKLLKSAYLSEDGGDLFLTVAGEYVQQHNLFDWLSKRSNYLLAEFEQEAKKLNINPNTSFFNISNLSTLTYKTAEAYV